MARGSPPSELVVQAFVAVRVMADGAEQLRAVAESLPKAAVKSVGLLLVEADRLEDLSRILGRELDRPDPQPSLIRRIAKVGGTAGAAIALASLTGAIGGAAQAWTEQAMSATHEVGTNVSQACAAVASTARGIESVWEITIDAGNWPQTFIVDSAERHDLDGVHLPFIASPTPDGIDLLLVEDIRAKVRHLTPGVNHMGAFSVRNGERVAIAMVDGWEVIVRKVSSD